MGVTKKFLFIITIIFSVLVIGCSSQENHTVIKEENKEVLADKSEVLTESTSSSEEELNWLTKKERELTSFIREQLKIEEESVKLVLAKMSEEELFLSIVLDLEQKIDKKSIQELVENMMKKISQEGNASLNKENIVITDKNNHQLN